jgi:hypothetical protein
MVEFRKIVFPYCLIKQEDGSYLVLNRNYKPVGFNTSTWVNYEDYPIKIKFKRLTSLTVSKISYNNDPNIDKIFLYNDGCVPTASAKNMNAYLNRLKILASLQVINYE